ncbi:MAG: hypothetical protein TREMPRED_000817 [Tremellales sp. Tagirdzhanova-0007]|nr:MAG: hypothetical protein TREMPRED_000817 [Tremellales sp. Tagirdzhanova-0007]
MTSLLATISSVGMAVGPPLVYVDQLVLLSICLHFAPSHSSPDYAPLSPLPNASAGLPEGPGLLEENIPHPPDNSSRSGTRNRPFRFWQWEGYGAYLEFLAGLIVVLGVLQVILSRWTWYIDTLGFVALTIESTLPIPQFISNYQRKSTYGLRASTLAGWFFGDAFKTAYFFFRRSPIQFQVTAVLTLCWDAAVAGQRLMYGTDPPGMQISAEDVEESGRLHVDEV